MRDFSLKKRETQREMTEISSWRSWRFLIFFSSISLQLISGLAGDPLNSKDKMKPESHAASGSSTGLRVVIIFLGLIAVVVFSVFLFKIWQKKKREEQHARLLRLFEDDDELELELGLRD